MSVKGVTQHRYKLVDSHETDSLQIEGVPVSKSWRPFFRKNDKFDRFIRTKVNPDGFLEYEKYVPERKEVIYSSVEFFNKKAEFYTKYELEQLKSKHRDKLIEIGKILGIKTTGKRIDFLIKNICEAQEKVKEEMFSTEGLKRKFEKIESEKIESTDKDDEDLGDVENLNILNNLKFTPPEE